MKIFLKISILFLFLISAAQAFKVEIKDLNGTYHSPKGEGLAKKFIIEGFNFLHFDMKEKPVTLTFIKKDRSIDITYDDQSYFWQDPPNILLEADKVSLKYFEAQTYKHVVRSSTSSFSFTSKKDFLDLRNLNVFCQNSGRVAPEPSDFVIKACSTQAKIKAQSVHYKDKTGKNSLTRLLNKIMPDSSQADLDITSFVLNVNQHQFNLKTNFSYKVATKITARGGSWYDMKTKTLKIRLDQVKVSFLNITSKVFKKIEEYQNENLQVRRPYIYLKR